MSPMTKMPPTLTVAEVDAQLERRVQLEQRATTEMVADVEVLNIEWHADATVEVDVFVTAPYLATSVAGTVAFTPSRHRRLDWDLYWCAEVIQDLPLDEARNVIAEAKYAVYDDATNESE